MITFGRSNVNAIFLIALPFPGRNKKEGAPFETPRCDYLQ
jgi:hypothetical protein